MKFKNNSITITLVDETGELWRWTEEIDEY